MNDGTGRDEPAGTTVLPVVEERVSVRRESRDAGGVRVRKEVREREVEVEAECGHDEVLVERVPIGRMVEAVPETRVEGDTVVLPVVEERLVTERRLVLVEEVRVTRHRRSQPVRQTVTLRREVPVVERQAGPDAPWLAEPSPAGAPSGVAEPTGGDPPPARGRQTMQTIIGVFDETRQAQQAADELCELGIARSDISIHAAQDDPGIGDAGDSAYSGTTAASSDRDGGFMSKLWHKLDSLFGDDDADNRTAAGNYAEAVRRGGVLLEANVDDNRVEQASDVMQRWGAVDVDQRVESWRQQGYTGFDASAPAFTAEQARAERQSVMPVIQEDLKVGKRTVERGGVRVLRRISEAPVQETVHLREERAVVERRPVDRPASAADLAGLKDETIEVRATAEEAVVEKTARVVEEVVVGKQVEQRAETIHDTVRRTDVDVQQVTDGSLASSSMSASPGSLEDPSRLSDASSRGMSSGLSGSAGMSPLAGGGTASHSSASGTPLSSNLGGMSSTGFGGTDSGLSDRASAGLTGTGSSGFAGARSSGLDDGSLDSASSWGSDTDRRIFGSQWLGAPPVPMRRKTDHRPSAGR